MSEREPQEAKQQLCTWCEKHHDNPVTVDPFSLGALAREMGAAAFGATCDQVNQAARRT